MFLWFSKDIFSAIYMECIKGLVSIRYRGYCLYISPHLILIYLQARVFQQFLSCYSSVYEGGYPTDRLDLQGQNRVSFVLPWAAKSKCINDKQQHIP
jgi:hypothetical protein